MAIVVKEGAESGLSADPDKRQSSHTPDTSTLKRVTRSLLAPRIAMVSLCHPAFRDIHWR